MELRKAVAALLRGRGFSHQGGGHRARIDDDFSFWVHVGLLEGQRDIAPGVGIRSERVENLMAELMALPPDPWHPTGAANVGYILDGEYRAWYPGADPEAILDVILQALERLRPFAHLPALPGLFGVRGVRELPHRVHALTAIALLLGDAAGVRHYLAEGERELCAQADEICSDFRGFQRRSLERLGAQD